MRSRRREMVCHPARSCVTLTTSPVLPDGFNNNALIASPSSVGSSDCQPIIQRPSEAYVTAALGAGSRECAVRQAHIEWSRLSLEYRGVELSWSCCYGCGAGTASSGFKYERSFQPVSC